MCISFSIQAIEHNQNFTIGQNALGHKFQCAHQALNRAYQSLGYSVNYVTLPSKRSLKESNSGSNDAELIRIGGIKLLYPNLIQIPVPLCYVDSKIISTRPIDITSFDQLKNFSVGITLGYLDHESMTKKYSLNVTRVARNDTLEDLLLKNRVDVIFSNSHKLSNLKKLYPDTTFYIIEPLNRRIGLYHYIHKKHQKLEKKLTHFLANYVKKHPRKGNSRL